MKNKAVRSILSDAWHCREIGRKRLSRRSSVTRVLRLVLKASQGDLGAGGEVLGMEGQGHQENSVTGEP